MGVQVGGCFPFEDGDSPYGSIKNGGVSGRVFPQFVNLYGSVKNRKMEMWTQVGGYFQFENGRIENGDSLYGSIKNGGASGRMKMGVGG